MKFGTTFVASTWLATTIAALCVSTASAVQLVASVRPGIGAIPYNVGLSTKGVTFRVWAPNAQAVSVAGSWNFYSNTSHQLASEGNGFWSGDVPNVGTAVQYTFAIKYNNVYTQKMIRVRVTSPSARSGFQMAQRPEHLPTPFQSWTTFNRSA